MRSRWRSNVRLVGRFGGVRLHGAAFPYSTRRVCKLSQWCGVDFRFVVIGVEVRETFAPDGVSLVLSFRIGDLK